VVAARNTVVVGTDFVGLTVVGETPIGTTGTEELETAIGLVVSEGTIGRVTTGTNVVGIV
jgi:hypothetical protein